MKKKLKEEIRAKTLIQLAKDVQDKTLELLKMKMDLRIGKLKNTSLLRVKADDLAVMETIMREKENSK